MSKRFVRGIRPQMSVHTSYKKLANGDCAIYAYAFKGGPQLCIARGTNETIAKADLERLLGSVEVLKRYVEVKDAVGRVPSGRSRVILHAMPEWFSSAEFERLAISTAREYRRYGESFRSEFSHFPLRAFEDPRSREDVYDFREIWRGKDRAADYAMQTLAAFFKWSRGRGWTTADPTSGIPRLYRSNRADKIWSEEQLRHFEKFASREVSDVVFVAAYCGLRLIDVLRLTWTSIGDRIITVQATKRDKLETKPILNDLRERLANIPKRSPTVLLNTFGKPWTTDGFRASYGAAFERAGLSGLMFRDLRGTACTRFYRAGITDPHMLARMFGWSLASVEKLIAVYVSPDALNQDLAEWARINSGLDMTGRTNQKRPLTNR